MKTLNINTAKKTIKKVKVGKGVKIYDFVNIYECSLGDYTQVGAFVEIQKGVKIANRCRIQSHTFICEGVTIEEEVFIGHGVIFINDKNPSVRKTLDKTWTLEPILIKAGATIGSGAIIMAGVTVGKKAFVGAGAVVIRNVADNSTVIGVPARPLRIKTKT